MSQGSDGSYSTKINDSQPLEVNYCPYCGNQGCTGTHYSYIISKWVTEFYCDECCYHTTIIHHVFDSSQPRATEEP